MNAATDVPQASQKSETSPATPEAIPPSAPHKKNAPPSPPNLLSQSLSRAYGSILPTSLTYILLSTRGSSPWRPAAVMSTAGRKIHSRPRIFTGPQTRTGHHTKKSWCFPEQRASSPDNLISRQMFVKKKRKLFPGRLRTSPSLFVLPQWDVHGTTWQEQGGNPIPDQTHTRRVSASRSRKFILVPFRWAGVKGGKKKLTPKTVTHPFIRSSPIA